MLVSKHTLFPKNPISIEMLQGVLQLNATTGKTKIKRPSKGQRKHNRRVKQEARKASVPANDANQRKRPA